MKSLVDEQTLTIFPTTNGPLLIDGPSTSGGSSRPSSTEGAGAESVGGTSESADSEDPLSLPRGTDDERSSALLFGENDKIRSYVPESIVAARCAMATAT